MNTWTIIIALLPTVLIVGTILGPALSHRRSSSTRDWPSPEGLDREEADAGEQRMPVSARESDLESGQPGDGPTESDREDQYLEDWMALQDRFVN